jgi:predicted kinase
VRTDAPIAVFRAGLDDKSSPLLFVECRASPGVLLARVSARQRESGRISDADAAVVRRQLEEHEPLDEVPEGARAELLTKAPIDELVATIEGFVDQVRWAG